MKKNYKVLGLLLLLSIVSYGQIVETWSYTLPDKVAYSGPAIADDGTIYIACDLGTRETLTYETSPENFFAINPNNTLKWKGHVNEGSTQGKVDQIISSPSINADGTVYISGHYGRRVHRFNQVSGDTLRTFYMDSRVRYSAPAFSSNGDVYVATRNNNDRGFRNFSTDLTTQNWIFEPGTDFNSVPAIASDGTVYAISTNGNIYAINSDGTQKWSSAYSSGGGYASSALALAPDGTIYASAKLNADADGVLKAYNPADGTEKWSVTFSGENAEKGGPAVAADGTVYLGNAGGKMQAFNSSNGTILWTYNTASNAGIEVVPAIDNEGRLYFGDTSGMFYVINSDGTEAYSPLSLGVEITSSAAINSDGTIYVGVETASGGKLSALNTSATGLQAGGWPMYANNVKHTSNVNAITLSISKESIEGFSVYPNPVNNDEFYISTALNSLKSVQIFDILGKQVYSKNTEANEIIKTSNFNAGVYILKVVEDDKIATTRLIIK